MTRSNDTSLVRVRTKELSVCGHAEVKNQRSMDDIQREQSA